MASDRENQLRLSRRERQIMDVLFRRGRATAGEVLVELPDPPSYSAVRAHLKTLEEKGHARHEAVNLRYVYMPVMRPEQARRNALRHLVDTFFEGSVSRAAAALLDSRSARLAPGELDRLSQLIEKARQGGRLK